MSQPMIYLTPAGNEMCAICKDDTGVHVSIPAELRNNYQEGLGQLCFTCAKKLLGAPVVSPPEEIFSNASSVPF